jgi:hypothetical protein
MRSPSRLVLHLIRGDSATGTVSSTRIPSCWANWWARSESVVVDVNVPITSGDGLGTLARRSALIPGREGVD